MITLQDWLGDQSWRILPVDALPEDKFKADMVLIGLDENMFPGSVVAHGVVYNDSRGIFHDGEQVRTSAVKQIVEIEGELFLETRNTMYRLINE